MEFLIAFIFIFILFILPIIIGTVKGKAPSFKHETPLEKIAEEYNLSRTEINYSYYFSGNFKNFSISIGLNNNRYWAQINISTRETPVKLPCRIGNTVNLKQTTYHILNTGNSSFDKKIIVQYSDSAASLALLTNDLKEKLLELKSHSMEYLIEANGITVGISQRQGSNLYTLRKLIKMILNIMNQLHKEIDNIDSLIKSSLSDARISERIEYIKALGTMFNNNEKAKQCLSELVNDANLEIRIQAAEFLDEKAAKDLASIFNNMEYIDRNREHIPRVINLFKKYPVKEINKAIENVLTSSLNETILIEALDYCLKSKSPQLLKHCKGLLKHGNSQIREKSLNVFALNGKVSDIEALFQEKDSSINPLWKLQIQETIEKIQGRITGGDKGWVSMDKDDKTEGDLSIADDDGKLSLEK